MPEGGFCFLFLEIMPMERYYEIWAGNYPVRGDIEMTDEQKAWLIAKNRMMDALTELGFPEALGDQTLRTLAAPKPWTA